MESWKSLNLRTETADISLPWTNTGPVPVRQGETTSLKVYRTFHRAGHQHLGFSSFDLSPDDLEKEGARRAEAYFQAQKGNDPWYPLPVPQGSELAVRTSTLEKQDLARWIEPFDQVIRSASNAQPFKTVKEHIRLEKQRVLYRDSFGRTLEETRFEGSLEVLFVPAASPDAQPYSAELRFSEFAPEVIQGFVEDHGRLACEAHQVQRWVPQGEFQLLLQGLALAEVLAYAVAQLGGPALYAGDSSLRVGSTLWDREAFGDSLSITVLGPLYNSPDQRGFDEDGVVLKPQTLVVDGLVKAFWSTQATSHWLALPLTGTPRNFSVSPGTLSRRDLAGRRILEIQRLRWFQVDKTSGDFSAEVGLADLHEGGAPRPVFGFTLAGNLRDILTNARFSCDVGVWEHYEGPEFLVVPSQFIRSI